MVKKVFQNLVIGVILFFRGIGFVIRAFFEVLSSMG